MNAWHVTLIFSYSFCLFDVWQYVFVFCMLCVLCFVCSVQCPVMCVLHHGPLSVLLHVWYTAVCVVCLLLYIMCCMSCAVSYFVCYAPHVTISAVQLQSGGMLHTLLFAFFLVHCVFCIVCSTM